MGFLKEVKGAIEILKDPSSFDPDHIKSLKKEVDEAVDIIMDYYSSVDNCSVPTMKIEMAAKIERENLSALRINDRIAIGANFTSGEYVEDMDALWGFIRSCLDKNDSMYAYLVFSENPIDLNSV